MNLQNKQSDLKGFEDAVGRLEKHHTQKDVITLVGRWDTKTVLLNGNIVSPDASQKIRNHSPHGFCWGYGGSGPAQLALAICLELFTKQVAQSIYQDFKWEFISKLPQTNFAVTLGTIDQINHKLYLRNPNGQKFDSEC